MTKQSLVVTVLMAVLLGLIVNLLVTLSNGETLTHQVTVVCTEHKTIARIAREEAEESAASNRNVLPKANIPGISHAKLVEITEKKQQNQLRHAAEYALIQKETC